ncbi:MAG TPA: hypothetical protein ENH85_10320 [Candidatus Scalindua sp.]|nr:hypothetical protein [Candidatus Scalindua sp.]
MSDQNNQRYYWLKLKDDFFNSDEIKLLLSMENGSEYVIFWQKILLKAITCKEVGLLEYKPNLPYTDKMFATIFDTNIDIVRGAIKAFIDLSMVTPVENGCLWIEKAAELTASETKGAIRKRKQRAIEHDKTKALPESVTLSQKRPQELELELEKEIDIEKELKVDTNSPTKMFTYVYKHLLNKQPTEPKILNFNANLLPLLKEFSLYQQIFMVHHLMTYSQGATNLVPFFKEFEGIGTKNFLKLIEDAKERIFLSYFSFSDIKQMRKYFDYHDRTDKRLTVKTSNMKEYLEAANIANAK